MVSVRVRLRDRLRARTSLGFMLGLGLVYG
jgi:hypothetical protein